MTAPPMKKSILVADGDADARLQTILQGCELAYARTLEEAAHAALKRNFDLIVIDMHFDDSRMFDLLRYLRSEEPLSGTPVICIRSHRFEWTNIAGEGLEIAVKALGGQAFIDLAKFGNDEAGNRQIRELIEGFLSA
jgi:CheY-like chemotaxis protein